MITLYNYVIQRGCYHWNTPVLSRVLTCSLLAETSSAPPHIPKPNTRDLKDYKDYWILSSDEPIVTIRKEHVIRIVTCFSKKMFDYFFLFVLSTSSPSVLPLRCLHRDLPWVISSSFCCEILDIPLFYILESSNIHVAPSSGNEHDVNRLLL